jgi:type IV pilus assembly protein PilX
MTKLFNSLIVSKRLANPAQSGVSLIVVLMILIVVSLIGVGGAQIALLTERGSRNDRDMQIALQSAEAGLLDAVNDMTTSSRSYIFDGENAVDFVTGCGTTAPSKGLCNDTLVGGKFAWKVVDFTDTSKNAPTVAFGEITGDSFASGGAGVQPALPPRYIIELVPDLTGNQSEIKYVYRVTVMGFGPRPDIQVVLQMIYRV